MVQRGKIFQVFAASQLPVDAALPGQDRTQAATDIVGLGDNIESIDRRRAAGWLEQRTEHADGRGLACAVGTQQAEDLTALDL